jgi:hypothetical protein
MNPANSSPARSHRLASASAVLGERGELCPPGRSGEERDLAFGDASEPGDHRQPHHVEPFEHVVESFRQIERRGRSGGESSRCLRHEPRLASAPRRTTSRQTSEPSGPSARLGAMTVSEIFDPSLWREVSGFDFTDITYHRAIDPTTGDDIGCVRIAFDRPEVRNAFRPHTVDELYRALDHARQTSDVGAVLLTGNGPSEKDGGWAFCSGGDQRIRGRSGYQYACG